MQKEMIELKLTRRELNGNTVIWKYFPFSTFVNLLMENNLLFRRVDKFWDKLEGSLSELAKEETFKSLLKITGDIAEARIRAEKEFKNIENHKMFTYANCWSINDDENYALWKIYLNNERNGLAIKTTINKLVESINYESSDIIKPVPIIITDVSYKPFGYKDINQNTVFTTKNVEYKYESELRLLLKSQRNFESKEIICEGYNDKPVKFIKVDLNKLIEKLVISPFSELGFRETIKKLLSLKELNFDTNKYDTSKITEE